MALKKSCFILSGVLLLLVFWVFHDYIFVAECFVDANSGREMTTRSFIGIQFSKSVEESIFSELVAEYHVSTMPPVWSQNLRIWHNMREMALYFITMSSFGRPVGEEQGRELLEFTLKCARDGNHRELRARIDQLWEAEYQRPSNAR